MTGFFSGFAVFFTPPVTQMALPPFSFMTPNPSVRPPEIDTGDEEEEEDDEEGGLAIESIPCIASRVLGEAGASSLKEKHMKIRTNNLQRKYCYAFTNVHS